MNKTTQTRPVTRVYGHFFAVRPLLALSLPLAAKAPVPLPAVTVDDLEWWG